MSARPARVCADVIDPWPVRAMRGLLDKDPNAVSRGDPLPLGWHWLYFRDPLPASSLGPDGHEARGAFMPTGDLPRRMWASGSLHAMRPVIVGEPAELRSRVAGVVEKTGRSGRLAFAKVRCELRQEGRRCVEEEQVIAYREAREPCADVRSAEEGAVRPPRRRAFDQNRPTPDQNRARPAWAETFLPTEVALFRFSALTYNAHRIHYDRPYAEAEGYPGLLVHAPLTVLALLDAAERRWGAAESFEYRATAPIFANQPVRLVGREASDGSTGSSKVAEALGPDGAPKLVGRFHRPS